MEAKKIIITGGATRIGAAIAKSLASYDVQITIHFNKSKNAAKKLKNKVYPKGRSTMGMPGTRPRKAIKKWKPKK